MPALGFDTAVSLTALLAWRSPRRALVIRLLGQYRLRIDQQKRGNAEIADGIGANFRP
jgi:hypothetical protein